MMATIRGEKATASPRAALVLAAMILALVATTHPSATGASGAAPSEPSPHRTTQQQRALAAIESLWVAGEIEACWTRLEAEIVAARAASGTHHLLDLLALRGAARARLGLVAAAEPDLREAIALAERLGAGELLRQCLRWRGFSLQRLGRSPEAAQCWERLLALARAAADGEHEAWARSGLALLHQEAGRPHRSLEEYEQALALFRACDDARGAAYVLNGLGTGLQSLGRYDDAIAHYAQAAEAARALGWTWLEALAQNNVAVLLFSLGDPGQARDLFRRTVALHQAAGDAAEAALAGVNVAKCDAVLGRFEQAAAELERIRGECQQLGIAQFDGSLCNALAGILHETGREHLAARHYRETLSADPAAPVKARLEALLALSRALSGMDSIPAALLALRQASPWITELDDPRLRLEYRIELGRRCLEAGRAAEALSLLAPAAREAEHLGLGSLRLPALAAAARAARARGLPDSALALLRAATAAWESERGLPVDPEWREIRGWTAIEIRTLLGSLLLEQPMDRSEDERARAAFDAVQVFKARTLFERMTGPLGAEGPALAFSAATCAQMQREILRPGELLLDFHLGRDESLLFALTQTECRGVRLPGSRSFEEALALYVRMVSAAGRARPDRGGGVAASGGDPASDSSVAAETRRRVRALLLGPVEELIGSSRSIIVVPDGILQRVSFAALMEGPPASGRSGPSRRPPIIQYVPSATILDKLRAGPRETRAPNGDPAHEQAALLALAGGTEANRAPLPGARGEVHDLAVRFRHVACALPAVDRLAHSDSVGTSASVEAALVEIGRHQLLHFATHATIEDQHPWRSRIHLGAGAMPGSGVVLTAADIVRARLAARLAVLSACRSAGGRVLSGEGVQGLAGAFLVAGVPAVVATLWPVDDSSTRVFMRRFYEHLADGAAVAEALAQAQVDLRNDVRWTTPYTWAGFIVIGDGDLTVALERKSSLSRHAGPLGLLCLGVVAVFGLPLVRYLRRRL